MNSKFPIGICNQMCPDEEIIKRVKENRLHILEISPNQDKYNKNYIVKEFRRSAAGQSSQDNKSLRTKDALLLTLNYLLHDVITRCDVKWNVIYDFIVDRLRAVRQDMIIQNFPRMVCISLLQPMIKFYVYAAYRLCEEPIFIYDPHINLTHLQECLKRLLYVYDDLDVLVSKVLENDNTFQYKTHNLLYSECRPLMEALYLILNLGNTTAMHRAINLPNCWRNNLVRKCLKLSLNCWKGNYVRVCRNILTLPPLLVTCAVLHLPRIRRNALSTMSKAYNCKNAAFSVNDLQKLLLYDNETDLLNDCSYYEISVINNIIKFNNSSVAALKTEPPSKRLAFVNEILSKCTIPELLLED